MGINLRGRDLLCTQDWSVDELEAVLELAVEMKERRYSDEHARILKHKTFMMMFYNSSLRTRQSFEAAATELGGHAQFLETKSLRLRTKKERGEVLIDTANVMSRYSCGIGVRILEDSVEGYGDGDRFLREFADLASVPIVSMAHDKFHPCQGLADVMGMRGRSGDMKGKTLLQIWGYSPMVRSWSSVQESILLNSRLGHERPHGVPGGVRARPRGHRDDEGQLRRGRDHLRGDPRPGRSVRRRRRRLLAAVDAPRQVRARARVRRRGVG